MAFYANAKPMNRLGIEWDRLFEGLFGPEIQRWATGGPVANFPPLNVWEDGEAYHVEAEVPGLALEDVEIVVKDRLVTISGKRHPLDVEGGTLHRNERPTGEFRRELRLGLPLNPDNVEATLSHGVLSLRLPKAESAKGRKITVKAG